MNDVNSPESINDLRSDFVNLLENYWLVIRTRECTRLPGEQERDEQWATDLAKKWNIS